jgi:uncharacterized membrane protein required for colicin V production
MWDLGVALFTVILLLAGWNAGLSNSWRTLIAIPFATLFSAWVYADFCAWFEQCSWIPSDGSLFVGYVIVWFFFNSSLETFMGLLLPDRLHTKLIVWDKLAGCAIGAIKAVLVLSIATLVSGHNELFPEPPRMLWFPKLISDSYRESVSVRKLWQLVCKLPTPAVKRLVAQNGPQFQPVFSEDTPTIEDLKRTQRIRELFRRMHEIENMSDQY